MATTRELSTEIVSNDGATVKGQAARRLVVGILSALLTLLVTTASYGSPFAAAGSDWEGYGDVTRLIRNEVGARRLVITSRLDWGSLTPEDALIVVYPEHSPSMSSAGSFVRSGGRLAILDDFGAADALLESFAIQRVPLPPHPALALRGNPDLAIAEPTAEEHPLTQGVERVVTNHATGLSQPQLKTVLRVRGATGDEVALALAAASGKGRLLAVGDPSIAMNAMLRYPGNLAFVKNLVGYLTEGHGSGRVYLVIASFTETGSFGGAPDVGQAWLDGLARGRATLAREGLPAPLLYWLSLAVALGVLAWLLPRALRAYRSQAPRYTRDVPLKLQGGAAGHAAALGAKEAYRGHALIEWQRAFIDDLTLHFGLARDVSVAEVVRRVARLGVVDAEGIRGLERVLLRMAAVETMVATKQERVLARIRDEEVVAAGQLVERVLHAVHGGAPARPFDEGRLASRGGGT